MFCVWSDLLNHVKDGKISMNVTITVDEDTIGGEPHPDFQKFLQPNAKTNGVLVIQGVKVYVNKEVFIFGFELKF